MAEVTPRRPLPSLCLAPTSGRAWSDLEASRLISAFSQFWHSIGRIRLTSHHWERVASLAAIPGLPARTGTQCRHKLEKLRKRFRQEKERPGLPHWIHFREIERMERGPVVDEEEDAEVEEEEEAEEEEGVEEREEEEDGEEALVAVVRRFEEGFMRMEKRRAEMMVEMEREWMLMEERRAEMVVEAERCMLDTISRAFKRPRTSHLRHSE